MSDPMREIVINRLFRLRYYTDRTMLHDRSWKFEQFRDYLSNVSNEDLLEVYNEAVGNQMETLRNDA